MARIRAKDLHANAIDVTPIDMDWNARTEEGSEQWRSWEVVECDTCGRYVVVDGTAINEEHRYIAEHTRCTGSITAEGPMMNYYYPLPDFEHDWPNAEDAVMQLKDLPLALVYFEVTDEYGLALTGGGMDLSWEIAEGFVRLGYLPPLHFAGLPNMAGMRLTPTRRLILAAFRRAISLKRSHLAWDAKRLRDLRAAMSEKA